MNGSHIGFQGRAMIARERFQMENVSENVAASKDPSRSSTESIMGLWKNSKDHHKNMLDDWMHAGMGVVVDSDGMIFATQIFPFDHLTLHGDFKRAVYTVLLP